MPSSHIVCPIVLFLQRIILFVDGKCLSLKLPINTCNTILIVAPNNINEQSNGYELRMSVKFYVSN